MSRSGTNIFLIATTSDPQQFEKNVGVKVDYFDFPGEIFEKLV